MLLRQILYKISIAFDVLVLSVSWPNIALIDCNGIRTHNHLVCQRTFQNKPNLPNDRSMFWVLICMMHLTVYQSLCLLSLKKEFLKNFIITFRVEISNFFLNTCIHKHTEQRLKYRKSCDIRNRRVFDFAKT